jgi:protein-L-isoaspartate(D-aspartate) O-methyltransferase
MVDFATLRQRMVDNQIRTGGVTQRELIKALLDVPREGFVASAEQPFAYADRELKLPASPGVDRRMMPPAQLARLIQTLPLGPNAHVMALGCGTGYSAAILGRLAGTVVAVEEDATLAATAQARLQALEAANITVVEARLTEGYPAEAPYEAILVDGAVEVLPERLLAQLRPEGSLAVIERGEGVSRAMLYGRVGGEAAKWPQFDAWAPLLPGFARKREFVF